jgi:enoyl-CoA hydratase/carnithine racemase
MADIVTEHAGSVLRVQFNRPTKRNAMTSAMYVARAGILNEAANDENTRVVLWHGAGDSFCAGNDIEDFSEEPSGSRRISASQTDGGAGQFRRTA